MHGFSIKRVFPLVDKTSMDDHLSAAAISDTDWSVIDKSIFEDMFDVAGVFKSDGMPVRLSKKFESRLDMDFEPNLLDAFTGTSKDWVRAEILEQLETFQNWSGELDLLSPGRDTVERFFIRVKCVQTQTGKTLIITGTDVSEYKLLVQATESSMVMRASTAKLLSLGEMAASIGHEINNPLTVVLGYAKQVRLKLSTSTEQNFKTMFESLTKHMDSVIKNADRIDKIIRALRLFARDGRSDPKSPTSLREVIDDAVVLCSQKIQNNAVSIDINDMNVTIPSKASQLCQIFTNLISNACDALEGVENAHILIQGIERPTWFEIHISDNGPGVMPAAETKLMNPFFTTKPPGKGTGLGLSISRKLAQDLGGDLSFEPELSRSTFVLRIPNDTP